MNARRYEKLYRELNPGSHPRLTRSPICLATVKREAIAKYQGASYWGEKYGTLHLFTIIGEYPARKLVAGTSTTDKIVRELGGVLPEDLKELKPGQLIYLGNN